MRRRKEKKKKKKKKKSTKREGKGMVEGMHWDMEKSMLDIMERQWDIRCQWGWG